MKLCRTDFGDIPVSGAVENYPDGSIRSCSPSTECFLTTEAGELIPQYSTDDLRRKTVQAVHFYENGKLKSLPLEMKTPVFTPAGIVSAEMVTFYESGKVKRVFPLNGKLSGYWAQEDEEGLAEILTLDTPCGPISAKVISMCFYESGRLRSLTLWPGDKINVSTPSGVIKTRVGLSFSSNGKIKSLEPAEPVSVKTFIGDITAYDPDAVGINGDANSLTFGENGEVTKVVTTLTSIIATHHSGRELTFIPEYRESLCGDGEREVIPMYISFDNSGVSICSGVDSDPVYLDFSEHEFRTQPFLPQLDNLFGALRCSV
ncbi:hypothetical protein [Maridesulfovibrio zosterae]|uniref:hypothetical protein n=1 Tax=Maridesulfovibrio zosterae TaxID=82171 RepID=UPI0003FFDB92|nr:hypothetical protein [Maridesulfovibrio zosterae]